MKTKAIYVTCLLATALLSLFSCQNKDETSLEELVEVAEAPGFLNLNASLKKQIQVTTGKKSLEEILENSRVLIIYFDPLTIQEELYLSSSYSNLPSSIELPPNDYRILIFHRLYEVPENEITSDQLESIGFTSDSYLYDGNFNVTSGETTTVNATLEMTDLATTVNFTEELLNNFPNIEATASVTFPNTNDDFGNPGFTTENLLWNSDNDEETGYFDLTYYQIISPGYNFRSDSQSANLNITLTAETNTGIENRVTRTYEDVEPNEHYMITVSYAVSTATINVSLGNEVIIEEEIPFPG